MGSMQGLGEQAANEAHMHSSSPGCSVLLQTAFYTQDAFQADEHMYVAWSYLSCK